MTQRPAPIRVVQMVTAPASLCFLSGLIDFLGTKGFASVVVCSPGEALEQFGRDHGVETCGVDMPRAITPLQDLGAVLRLRRCLRRLRPQIVHAGTPKGGLLGMIAARLAGVPVRIYQMRGLPFLTATGTRRKLLWWCEKVACTLAHRVVCNSFSLRAAALEERLCSPEKAVVIAKGSGQGVDAVGWFNPERLRACRAEQRAALGLADDALVIAFIGRLVGDKGLTELVTAWQALREEFPNLHLLLAGDPETKDPITPQCAEILSTDPRIHRLGHVSDVAPLYATVDLVVLPTYREGFPNVLLEAAAMGLPVVSTRIPGCVDAVEEEVTGLLVPARDAEALATAMRRYLADPDLRRAHGQAGRQRVLENFQQEVVWEGVRQQYLTLLGKADAGEAR